MLFNCGHAAHNNLTIDDVNTKPGNWLHNFSWLEDDDIGAMSDEWNWLDGHSSSDITAKNVHFTRGGPWFKGWKPLNPQDVIYKNEWEALRKEVGG